MDRFGDGGGEGGAGATAGHLPTASSPDVQGRIDELMAGMPELCDALGTLRWIVERIDAEAEKKLRGGSPRWAAACVAASNEAQGALGRVHELILRRACRLVDEARGGG